MNTYRITLNTVPYVRRFEPTEPTKQVETVIIQTFKNDRKAVEEAHMYDNAPFFGQRLNVTKVEILDAVSIDNYDGTRTEHWRELLL